MRSLPTGWRSTTLGQLFSLQRGFDLPARSRRPGPYRVLSSGGVAGSHDEGPVKGPGLVIGRATNLGEPTWSDDDYWPLNTTLFVKDFRGNDPRFVFYLLTLLDLSGYNSGSVQPMLNRNYIAQVPLVIPSTCEQQGIAATLGALDDKIESNHRLASLGIALIAAMVRLSLAKGSKAIPVSGLARFINGGAFTRSATGTGRMVIRIAELTSGPGESTVHNDLDVLDDKLARPGDLLMSWSGSLDIYRWARPEAIVNQHIFKVIPADLPSWLVHDRLAAVMPTFQAIAKDKATTMGHIQRGHLHSTFVELPDHSVIAELHQSLGLVWERLLAAERESLCLQTLRDVLLPELMSGRLRVPEAREAVEAVT